MIRRSAVTLIEVLIAMFIMAIGMLALLVLFPLGAVSMAQALKDDRCASTAAMAENVAIATNLRSDLKVTTAFASFTPLPLTIPPLSPMVYVDPYGAIQGLASVALIPLGTPGYIPRVAPGLVVSQQLADRWFSLPDDITFSMSGTPDISSGFIDRGRRYSYAYLLKQLQPNLIQEYVVVYSGRPVGTLAAEMSYPVTVLPPNGLQLAVVGTTIKRGGWILDPINGYFYRVTNLTDTGIGTTVEVQPNLVGVPTIVVVLDNVVEVFDKGTNAQP